MSANMSRLARNGSFASVSSTGTVDSSSHNHVFDHIRHVPKFPSWLEDSWLHQNHLHEAVATGTLRMGMTVWTRELMEFHITRAPDVRGMLDCLPVEKEGEFIGWRKKLGTWPIDKHRERTAREFAC